MERAASLLDERTIALAAPEVPLCVRHRLLKEATERGALRVAALTSAEMARSDGAGAFFATVDLLALNEDEAAALAGVAFDPAAPGAPARRLRAPPDRGSAGHSHRGERRAPRRLRLRGRTLGARRPP